MPSYVRPDTNRRSRGRPARMQRFNAPLPSVPRTNQRQSVATPAYVRRAVRKAMKSQGETKHVIQPYNRQTLYHNGGTSGVSGACQFNLLGSGNLPSQGDNESNRDGNKILIRGVRMNMLITFPYDRLASKVIMYILRVNKGYNPLGAYGNLFDSLSSNWLLDSVDTARVKVLKKKIFTVGRINPNVPVAGANREVTIPFVYYLKLNKYFTFHDDNTNDNLQPYDYVCVFAGYDAWGSLASDIVSYVKLDQKIYFKDI